VPLTLCRRRKSPNWYVRGTVLGQEVFETAGTADRALAEQYLDALHAKLWNRGLHGDSATAVFADAALSYLNHEPRTHGTRRYVHRLLDHFCPGWEKPGADERRWKTCREIGQAEADRCLSAVLRPGSAPATRTRLLAILSAVLTHAARRGLCERPSFDRPRQPPGRIRWVTHAEAARMIECAAPHLRPLVTFLFYTGARVAEAIELEWRDVDLSRARVAFVDTKTGERRGVPLHEAVVVTLANLPHKTGRVFRRPDGQPYADKGRREGGQFKRAFAGMCRRAEVDDFHPHDCRHTWATWLYAETRDLLTLQKLGGWKTLSMVQRYAHVNPDNLASSIRLLPALATESVHQTGASRIKVAGQ
jgi:integrase